MDFMLADRALDGVEVTVSLIAMADAVTGLPLAL